MRSGRIMIAAVKSGSGKTLITSAIMRLLNDSGKKVAPFKCGPDYIDPMYHRIALGHGVFAMNSDGDIAPGGNLDTYFTPDEVTVSLLREGMGTDSDIAVIEGVMGLYDGVGGISPVGSSYDLARAIQAPIILTVDAKGMGASLAALIKGFLDYDEYGLIKGVILNRISGMYYEKIRSFLEEETGIRLLGYVPEDESLHIDSRHLGLVVPDECKVSGVIDNACRIMRDTVDVKDIMDIAYEAGSINASDTHPGSDGVNKLFGADKKKVAIAMDEAFCFYYRENLRRLKAAGYELVPFSPIHDKGLPHGADVVLLGGGYPELHLEELSDNLTMTESIRQAYESGVKIIAECGGFMYLHETVEDMDAKKYDMTGILPGNCYWTGRLKRFGYCETVRQADALIFKGHEFHYFESTDPGEALILKKPGTGRTYPAMHITDRLFAGFIHLYYPSLCVL